MKKTIATLSACLMFVAIITLPMLNTAAALTNTSASVTHRDYTAQQATTTPTAMVLGLSTIAGNLTGASLTVKVNEKFIVLGAIGSGTSAENADPVGGMKVNILMSVDQQKWANLGNFTSGMGQKGELPKGEFGKSFVAPSTPGVYYFVANFPGDSQYAPSHSNVATLTVTQ